MAVAAWSPLVAQRNILISVDNSSAEAALSRGYSPKVDSALMIQDLCTARAGWRCGDWLDRA